jgi:NAD(P)-dependent dehydrogenase (short-subunit alcohol dehydrogenase family)
MRYKATKSGVIGFTRDLARDVAPAGIAGVRECRALMVKQRHVDALDESTDTARTARMDKQLERIAIAA